MDGPLFKRVLACVALSPHVKSVLREATALATAFRSELVLLHVGEGGTQSEDAIRRAAREAGLDADSLRIFSRAGKPEDVILRQAVEADADLIYAGARPEETLIQEVRGSVARNLARRADRSIYLSIHRKPADRPPRSIVAAVDLTPSAADMLTSVAEYARRCGAGVLHVVREFRPFLPGTGESIGGVQADAQSSIASAEQRFELADWLAAIDLHGVEVRPVCIPGRDGVETVRYAELIHADLLTVATPRRRYRWFARFLRHPAEFWIHKLSCSLLIHRSTTSGGAHTA